MTGYSATIDLQLTINGVDYELCKTGPADVVIRNPSPIAVPADTVAVITVTTDGRARSEEVRLAGIEIGQKRVGYSRK
jgi:predicted aspartyl protease